MFSSIPELYPLEAGSTPLIPMVLTTKNDCRYCQVAPGGREGHSVLRIGILFKSKDSDSPGHLFTPPHVSDKEAASRKDSATCGLIAHHLPCLPNLNPTQNMLEPSSFLQDSMPLHVMLPPFSPFPPYS